MVVSGVGSTVSPETNIICWISSALKSFPSPSSRMLSSSFCGMKLGIFTSLETLDGLVGEVISVVTRINIDIRKSFVAVLGQK